MRHWLKVTLTLVAGGTIFAAEKPASMPAASAANQPQAVAASEMSYLDNGRIRLGVDLALGGAITCISASGSADNIVNSYDWGRQIQMSYYSGPNPFTVGDKKPHPHWAKLGWNPIQVGDCYGNRAKILEHRNDGNGIYVKCIPMQWPLNNVPGDCVFESWITLDGPAANVRSRITNRREDKTQYTGRDQECPAVYVNGPLCNLVTYTGDKPFTGDSVNRLNNVFGVNDKPFSATENWAAYVRSDDWGLGVWMPQSMRFLGAFNSTPGKGGPRDNPTGYISPILREILDHNIQHEYRYALILGTVKEIRQYVYAHADRPAPPHYEFKADRRHWCYHDSHDTGWPIQGELNVILDGGDPQLIAAGQFWLAQDAPKLYIRAAFTTTQTVAQVYWKAYGDPEFSAAKCVNFPIQGDGEYRTYEVNLAANPEYKGALVGLRIDPVVKGGEGQSVRIQSISFRSPDASTTRPTAAQSAPPQEGR